MSQPAPSSVATTTPSANGLPRAESDGPQTAPDASGTRQGPVASHFHVYLLWHPLHEVTRRQVIASSPDFDAILDAYHRKLAQLEQAGRQRVKAYRLRTELDGALVVYLDVTHLFWVGVCDHEWPPICLEREEGWYHGLDGRRPLGALP